MKNSLKLVSMGILTETHIKNLEKFLTKETTNFTIYDNDLFISNPSPRPTRILRGRVTDHKDKILAVQSTQSLSTTLWYDKMNTLYATDSKNIILKGTKSLKKKSLQQSINCSGLMALLFKGITEVNNFHKWIKIPTFFTATSTPASLIPTKYFQCVENDYKITLKGGYLPSLKKVKRPVLSNILSETKAHILSYLISASFWFGVRYVVVPLTYGYIGKDYSNLMTLIPADYLNCIPVINCIFHLLGALEKKY